MARSQKGKISPEEPARRRPVRWIRAPAETSGHVEFALSQCGQNIVAARRDVTDPSRLHREWETARAQVRAENPLPIDKITGSVDVYPHRQNVVLAYDLNYRPRPVISSPVATSQT